MRTLYWDCFAGISGDMALGSLIDAGADPERLRKLLARLPLNGWQLEIREDKKNGFRGVQAGVRVPAGGQPHRRLADIERILATGDLPEWVAQTAARVFRRLAAAEARVHGTSPAQIHFHEVGAVDAIIEIVGSVAALHLLGIERIQVSPLPLGRGFVRCAHGLLPVPAPAVLELLRGLPTAPAPVDGELVTPTGAALVATLAEAAGPIPDMRIDRIGYGVGSAVFPFPNLLRAIIGEVSSTTAAIREKVTVLETVLDDVNPEHYPFYLERLRARGALDAYLTPLTAKKGRPGIKLTVLSPEHVWRDLVKDIILETGTLGVRVRHEDRVTVAREILRVDTAYGPVRVKIARLDGVVVRLKAEYEDCRELALRHGVPVRVVTFAAEKAAAESIAACPREFPAGQRRCNPPVREACSPLSSSGNGERSGD